MWRCILPFLFLPWIALADDAGGDPAWKTARARSRAKAIEQYPALADPQSPLRLRVNALITAAQDDRDKLHHLLYEEDAPFIFATIAATAERPSQPAPVSTSAGPPMRSQRKPISETMAGALSMGVVGAALGLVLALIRRFRR